MTLNDFFLYGPAVPGAIAPVDATDEMTNAVGIKRCRLYVDAPTTEEMSSLEERVTNVESNTMRVAYVTSGTVSGTLAETELTINFDPLPDGYVIDYLDLFLPSSIGTMFIKMYNTRGFYFTSFDVTNEHRIEWGVLTNDNGHYRFKGNTGVLYTSDFISNASAVAVTSRIYYHIEG